MKHAYPVELLQVGRYSVETPPPQNTTSYATVNKTSSYVICLIIIFVTPK